VSPVDWYSVVVSSAAFFMSLLALVRK